MSNGSILSGRGYNRALSKANDEQNILSHVSKVKKNWANFSPSAMQSVRSFKLKHNTNIIVSKKQIENLKEFGQVPANATNQ